jgi:hypothetical protein
MITPGFSLTATERVLPKLALDFTTASLDPRITFTRALNTATVTNSSGYIVGINADLPRFDYDPVTLACKGLLIEESRANAYTYSNTLNNTSVWNTARASINANATTSPDGTNNGWFLKEDSTASSTHVLSAVRTVVIGTTYTISMYAKAGTRTYFSIGIYDNTTLNAWFNLSNGTLGTVNAGLTAAITPAGNGWYRCSITRTAAATTIYETFYLANADNSVSYSGDGTSGLYLYGGQHEIGAFATSYIPTTTTALTRNADVASMTGTNFSSWYNASQGTIFVQSSRFTTSTVDNQTIFSIQNAGSQADGILGRYRLTTGIFRIFGSNAGAANQFILDGTAVANNVVCKGALGNATNDVGLSFNAGAVTTDLLSTIGSVSMMLLGSIDTGDLSYLNGHLQKFNFYSQRLTNAELQAISK